LDKSLIPTIQPLQKRIKMLELITVKEYSKRENISDTASRKRLDKGLIQSIQLDEITYIIYKSDCENIIKDLKNKIKFQKEQIAKYKISFDANLNKDEKIKELEIELKEYILRERNLYEKVIGQFDRMSISKI
jgi:hypothetical protein